MRPGSATCADADQPEPAAPNATLAYVIAPARRTEVTTKSDGRESPAHWPVSIAASTAGTRPTAGTPPLHRAGPGAFRRRFPRGTGYGFRPWVPRAIALPVALSSVLRRRTLAGDQAMVQVSLPCSNASRAAVSAASLARAWSSCAAIRPSYVGRVTSRKTPIGAYRTSFDESRDSANA